jgi:leucyl aminopeptidase
MAQTALPTLTAASDDPVAVPCDLLVVPVFKGGIEGAGAAPVLDALGFSGYPTTPAFRGDLGQHLLLGGAGVAAGAVLLVGLGRMDAVSPDLLRRAATVAARASTGRRRVATTLPAVHPSEASLQAVAEGLLLGCAPPAWREGRGDPGPPGPRELVLLLPSARRAGARVAFRRAASYASATLAARRLVETPPGEKPPDRLAREIVELTSGSCTAEVHDVPALERLGCGGILGVGRGSVNPPRLVELRYEPANPLGHVALVGKGITFDTGGLSLKPTSGMAEMKSDMAGAAAIAAACSVLGDLGVRLAVTALLPLAENMPGGDAQRPDDVLRMADGQTVEVLDTDAEGRLVLADALALAVRREPYAIVDLATLTGSAIGALGRYVGALMSNDDQLAEALQRAGDIAGEALWPLPLPEDLAPFLRSEVADLRNIADTPRVDPGGGALTAGLFLQRFVRDVPWAHLDIAGPAYLAEGVARPWHPVGATGFGVRTLLAWLERRGD